MTFDPGTCRHHLKTSTLNGFAAVTSKSLLKRLSSSSKRASSSIFCNFRLPGWMSCSEAPKTTCRQVMNKDLDQNMLEPHVIVQNICHNMAKIFAKSADQNLQIVARLISWNGIGYMSPPLATAFSCQGLIFQDRFSSDLCWFQSLRTEKILYSISKAVKL